MSILKSLSESINRISEAIFVPEIDGKYGAGTARDPEKLAELARAAARDREERRRTELEQAGFTKKGA